MARILFHCLVSLAALSIAGSVHANVFTLVQVSGPDPNAPQPGDIFGYEIHYEQTTELASLGFSARTTGGVSIVAATPDSSAGCYTELPCGVGFCEDLCPLNLLPAPSYQFNVTNTSAGPWAYIVAPIPASNFSVDAGTIDDGALPPGGPVGTVTVEYEGPGTLEIIENAATDDESYGVLEVISPTLTNFSFDVFGVPMLTRWGWIALALLLISTALASRRKELARRRS